MALRAVESAVGALSVAHRNHLHRLAAWWPLLSDLCFSDLVVYLRGSGEYTGDFVMVSHIRPVTSQTIYPAMIEGGVRTPQQRPLIAEAFEEGRIVEGEIDSAWLGEQIRVRAIPVRCMDEIVAVVAREAISSIRRAPGELEGNYAAMFDRLAGMLAAGALPFPDEEDRLLDGPRVGDGVIVVDGAGVITFASPNAISALVRSGMGPGVVDRTLGDVGLYRVGLAALVTRQPASKEIEMPTDTVISVRCIPLIEPGSPHGGVDGALVLIRDVSDIRRRDRLLVSKDATIREIHHRVKNNLQTISSLLRIQGRRLVEPSAREAIEESVRRIRSIALVHEILSRDPGEDVELAAILRPLVRMVEEALVAPDRPVRFVVDGDGGSVPAPTATGLAVVLNELLQNAVEHAFPPEQVPAGEAAAVSLSVDNDGVRVHLALTDDGIGLPDELRSGYEKSLGLSIVKTLVTTELGGTITIEPAGFPEPRVGTRIELDVPLERPDDQDARR